MRFAVVSRAAFFYLQQQESLNEPQGVASATGPTFTALNYSCRWCSEGGAESERSYMPSPPYECTAFFESEWIKAVAGTVTSNCMYHGTIMAFNVMICYAYRGHGRLAAAAVQWPLRAASNRCSRRNLQLRAIFHAEAGNPKAMVWAE